MPDYIELGPDDVIREGDQFWAINEAQETYSKCTNLIGTKIKPEWLTQGYKFRRPRHVAIRDAALELLRAVYGVPMLPDVEHVWPEAKALRNALGVSVEELRGGDGVL